MTITLISPGEIAFTISGFPIYFYGIFVAIGTLLGFYLSYFIAKKYYTDFDTDILYDVITFAIIGGFIFARLYYCLVNWEYYYIHTNEIFLIRQGGLSIHGGIIGGFLIGGWYAKIMKLPVLKIADITSFGLIFAQAVGRWGNFFNNEAYGNPTEGFLSVFIPEANRISGYENFEHFQPTFLYESVLDIVILLILIYTIRKTKNNGFDGFIFALYLLLYSFVRFFIEGLRLDNVLTIANLHVAQFVSIIIFSLALIFIISRISKD